jgi:hypothetical protein
MNANHEPEGVFPLDAPATRPDAFRAARLASVLATAPTPIMMGHRAFIRSGIGRRAKSAPKPASPDAAKLS